MVGRRGFFRRLSTAAAVTAGGGMAGCGGWWRVPAALIRPPELRVAVPGFATAAGEAAVAALGRAAAAYAAAGRGALRLAGASSLIPSSTWFYCGPAPSALCAPGVESTALFGGFPQVYAADGLPIEVSGRTALGVEFGAAVLPVPQPTLDPTTLPDLILAYDVWCYWLGVLGAPVAAAWKQHAADTEGLPAGFGPRKVPVPGAGLSATAIPLLRNPIVVGATPAAPWREAAGAARTWRDVAELVAQAKGPVTTRAFSANPYFPGATESALAMAVEAGAVPGGPPGTGVRGAASAALATLHGIVEAGAPGPASAATVAPAYLWTPLSVAPAWSPPPESAVLPFPAGTRSRAVPCTYLCATVNPAGPRAAVALDFAFFLLSAQGQEALSPARVGLPLRMDQALAHIARYLPYVTDPPLVASPADDLSAERVAGGPVAGAGPVAAFYAAVDAFAGRARAASVAPGGPYYP